MDGVFSSASRHLYNSRTSRPVRNATVQDPVPEEPQPADGHRHVPPLRMDDHRERSVPHRERRLCVLYDRVVPAVHVTGARPGHRPIFSSSPWLDVRVVLHARLSRHVPLLHHATEDVLP